MRTLLLFCFLQLVFACSASKLSIEKVIYKPEKYSPKVIAYLPKGYVIKRITAEGDTDYFYQFADSSVFYIASSFAPPHVYQEIKKTSSVYNKEAVIHQKGELLLSGKDSLGNYWTDRTIAGLSIGFYNVKPANLAVMQNAMQTVVVKKP